MAKGQGLIATVGKCLRMLPAKLRWHWALLVPLALLNSLAESGGALTVFALIQLVSDPTRIQSSSWTARLVSVLPWQDPHSVILEVTLLAVAYQLLKGLLVVVTQYLRHKVAAESSVELSCGLLRRYLKAPYAFHLGHSSAELIRNCNSGVNVVLGRVMTAASAVLTEVLVGAGLIAVLVAAAPGVSLAGGSLLFGLILLLLRLMRPLVLRWGREAHQLSLQVLQSLQQALGGIKETKTLGREGYFYDAFVGNQERLLEVGYLGVTLEAIPQILVETLLVCGALLALAVWTFGHDPSQETLPLLGLFAYSGFRLIPVANRLLMRINEIRGGAVTVVELYDDFVLLDPSEWGSEENGKGGLHREIVLENVDFAYPGASTSALRGISLQIRRGESIGLVGPTGAGKSTLVDVVAGLLSPTSGRVLVDDSELAEGSGAWLRRVGYVPHAVFLIDDTLRRNIAFGIDDGDVDEKRLREVVGLAQLERTVAELTEGFETRLGERGIRLSAGERQRVGIARALYHRPDLLILDEATAALDRATEVELVEAINGLRGSLTLLVVSHRLSTVRGCDRLVFLVGGRIAASGSFEELHRASDEFRTLVSLA